jgi:hypothetical protein
VEKRFLVWHEEQHSFFLLGYLLPLKPKEQQILRILIEEEGASMETILEKSTVPLNQRRIPTYVFSINEKAIRISGRKLLKFEGGQYHIINAM